MRQSPAAFTRQVDVNVYHQRGGSPDQVTMTGKVEMVLCVSCGRQEPPGALSRLRLSDVPIVVQAQILKQGFRTSGLDTFCPNEQMNLPLQWQEKALPLKRHI